MTVAQAPLHERSIQFVKGVGPSRFAQLAKLGIATVEDACLYPPSRYEDRTRWATIRELQPGETATVRGKVLVKQMRGVRGGRTIFEIAVGDSTGVLHAVWFNQTWLAKQLEMGQTLILHGRVEVGARPQLVHPEIERVEDDSEDSIHMGRIVPVYPLSAGIYQRWLRQLMSTVVETYAGGLEETLPETLRAAYGWPGIAEAVRSLHFPASADDLEKARQRLSFEELLLVQLHLAQRRAKTIAKIKPHHYQADGPLTRGLRERLPFCLTAAQQRVADELSGEMLQQHPMHRLLQGDVGCGKTIVVILLMAMVVQSGGQVAIMAPTELLAEQHARVIEKYLGPLGVKSTLLAQSVSPTERKARARGVASGEIQIVAGTHALVQSTIAFRNLWLAVIDEQHKFGVIQRAQLAGKANEPDVLVMTATPIPRTLALSLYGDLAVSTINQLPPGRPPIKTVRAATTQRSDVYFMLRQQLKQGRQAYIVYPLVEEKEASELKAATQMAAHLQRTVFPEFKVGLLHGQINPQDKEKTMRAFAEGQIQLLVSTIIVEVGIDVPNATVMVIEHPERFGLAQLHQLRGRIGRGAHAAHCIAISDAMEDGPRQRLEAFVDISDGFQLAEKDLEQRGPGELLGRRQSGLWRLRIADLLRDRKWLDVARQEAQAIIARDPDLHAPDLWELRNRLTRLRKPAPPRAGEAK